MLCARQPPGFHKTHTRGEAVAVQWYT